MPRLSDISRILRSGCRCCTSTLNPQIACHENTPAPLHLITFSTRIAWIDFLKYSLGLARLRIPLNFDRKFQFSTNFLDSQQLSPETVSSVEEEIPTSRVTVDLNTAKQACLARGEIFNSQVLFNQKANGFVSFPSLSDQ